MRIFCFILSFFLLSVAVLGGENQSVMAAAPAQLLKEYNIRNLYKVSTDLYRSAQPGKEDWVTLEKIGIRSVINLRNFGGGKEDTSPSKIRSFYLKWKAHRISENDLVAVLKLIKDAPKPVLIHCFHGSDRTGAAVAAYRVVFENMLPEDAAKELTDGPFGHHKMYANIPKLIRKADWDAIRKEVDMVNDQKVIIK